VIAGAGGGTRTRTPSLAPDFESGASTNSTTPAGAVSFEAKGRSIPAMELKDIWARVGDRQVFQGLNLQSDARHIGLIGANGSGKSTLLRLLQGLIVPERGSIRVERPVGLVFQNPDHQILFPTVLEELTFGLTERGVPAKEAEVEAREMARRYDAFDLLELATHELSAGQKTLVCILSVLMDRPKTTLLDESFSHLDLMSSLRMTQMVRECPARVILSTHQTHLLRDFDEVIWLDGGTVQMQGKPEDVLKAYESWAGV
jgi:biotin transport system ATP-binding protein